MFGGQRAVALGYQQLTATAALITPTVPTGANAAVISIETNAARYRDDGTAPTAAVGNLIPVTASGLPFEFTGSINQLLFFPVAAGAATVNIAYYKLSG